MPFNEEKAISDLVKIYQQAFTDILNAIVADRKKGRWEDYHKAIMSDILGILGNLDARAEAWAQINIQKTFDLDAGQARDFIKQAQAAAGAEVTDEGQNLGKFAQLNQQAVSLLVNNMSNNLRQASDFVGRRIKDELRQAGIEAAARKIATGSTIKEMQRNLIDKLTQQGFSGFKDSAGRLWRLDTYAEMVARTTTREAGSQAVINQVQAIAGDLVKITVHYPTCEHCAPLQGKVYSITGKDKRYPKLELEFRPPIHPNCRHTLQPYFREYDDNPDILEKFSKASLTEDPRSEAEKQHYKEIRDERTIKTNRKRARETLYNATSSIEDKQKAAEKLLKTYEKAGKKPVGRDKVIIEEILGKNPGKNS